MKIYLCTVKDGTTTGEERDIDLLMGLDELFQILKTAVTETGSDDSYAILYYNYSGPRLLARGQTIGHYPIYDPEPKQPSYRRITLEDDGRWKLDYYQEDPPQPFYWRPGTLREAIVTIIAMSSFEQLVPCCNEHEEEYDS